MKKTIILMLLFFPMYIHGFTGAYIGWEPFSSTALPTGSKANNVVFGIVGNSPTRVYFSYNVLGNVVYTTAPFGHLGWGLDLGAGIGYRFLNAAHKKSGWDVGMDLFAYFAPYFLNSETGYTETALYYGVGLGLNSVYKINPHVGVGFRAGMKFNAGSLYLSSKQPSTQGLLFFIGALLTF
ncbi:MAG: hypothetical protein ACRCVW_04575 [Brevinema sp.]